MRLPHRFPAVVLLLTSALILTACPAELGESTPTPARDAGTPSPESPEPDAAEPDGEPIRIGFFAPLTGPAAADGESAGRGAELAVALINEQGGVLGRPIALVVYDDAFSPDEAANVTRRLIEQDEVVAVVSGSYSHTTRAAAPIAERDGVPFMAAYAVHPEITQVGEHIWRIGEMAEVQGRVGAELVVDNLGAQRVAILTIDNDFGISLVDSFKARLADLGAEIVYEERYPLGESDFRPLLGGIADAEPDVIYATGYFNEAAQFVRQAREAGIEAQIVGQEGYDSPRFIEQAGETAEGVIITTLLDRDDERELVQEYLRRFEEEYGDVADAVGAASFDAIQVIAAGIEAAGSTDAAAILDGLRSLEDFEDAVTGPILEFTEGREVVRAVTAQIVQGGEFRHYATFDDRELVTPSQ